MSFLLVAPGQKLESWTVCLKLWTLRTGLRFSVFTKDFTDSILSSQFWKLFEKGQGQTWGCIGFGPVRESLKLLWSETSLVVEFFGEVVEQKSRDNLVGLHSRLRRFIAFQDQGVRSSTDHLLFHPASTCSKNQIKTL